MFELLPLFRPEHEGEPVRERGGDRQVGEGESVADEESSGSEMGVQDRERGEGGIEGVLIQLMVKEEQKMESDSG